MVVEGVGLALMIESEGVVEGVKMGVGLEGVKTILMIEDE